MRPEILLLAILIAVSNSGCAIQPYESVVDKPRVKITLRKNNAASEVRVIVFEPNEDCDFKFKGRAMISGNNKVQSFYFTPGRKYFRVTAEQRPFMGLHGDGGDVSFITNVDTEYVIEFKNLGAEFTGTGTELSYEINYLHGPLSDLEPVDVDHFSVCEREGAEQ
ncbi:MAG: hypothetical protein QNK34_03155 [Woeseiaceae bacterium]|nr:hypothetical protein [Woeseiaceae bacterium]